MVSEMSASASAQFFDTSKTSHAMYSILRERIVSPNAEQQAGALFDRSVLPGFKSLERGFHCWLNMLFTSLLMNADDLRRF